MTITPEALYTQLGRLVEATPATLGQEQPISRETQEWLGRVAALIAESRDSLDIAEFQTYAAGLTNRTTRWTAGQNLMTVVYRALAKAELKAPASLQGSFVPAGNAFDAMATVGKILGPATRDVLIVDPYLDEKVLTDFALLAPERVQIRLLADQQKVKPTLQPAAARWASQYGAARPLSARLAAPRTLHDRLIAVDQTEAWVLTQSLNAFAARSPATIVRVDAETAALKIAVYEAIWAGASNL